MDIELIPIRESLGDNTGFLQWPECAETLEMTVLFYARVGYSFPWIGYYARLDGHIVGSAGFKGRPMHGKVEIAYGTFPQFRSKGIGTALCKLLVDIARATDPEVRVTARTLRTESHSTRILRRNNFIRKGTVKDPEDGKVWEWEFNAG